ncbi:hypothetical protein [Frigoriglobus tundricola]|uniref:Lipoprotein n=1 Tax=Frigoriglobus tundricola TaxID=2774151 RepID=A0A6M5YLU6_9BACT|nr:hypothetical protein [Frigoriglobus tundricola]QJW94296.1 hypothetical protein FTUN_1816 [Frigoriglobus tundricola]
MMTKRYLLSWIAFAAMFSLTGCCNGCRRDCNSSGSYAPPPAACCGPSSPPAGYGPPVTP